MAWSEVAARHHARRLEREGWLERCPMARGDGSLFLATRTGVAVLGLDVKAARTPAPTWWAHDSACAWTAAWLTIRDREILGPRELLDDPRWAGQLAWVDRNSAKRSGHRPDLIVRLNSQCLAVEVELAAKSRARLKAILDLHVTWVLAGRTNGVVYVCGSQEGCDRVERAGKRVGLLTAKGTLRVETLDKIKSATIAAHEQKRVEQTDAA